MITLSTTIAWTIILKGGPKNASLHTYEGGMTLVHEGECIAFSFHPKTKLLLLITWSHAHNHEHLMQFPCPDSGHSIDILQAANNDGIISLRDLTILNPTYPNCESLVMPAPTMPTITHT